MAESDSSQPPPPQAQSNQVDVAQPSSQAVAQEPASSVPKASSSASPPSQTQPQMQTSQALPQDTAAPANQDSSEPVIKQQSPSSNPSEPAVAAATGEGGSASSLAKDVDLSPQGANIKDTNATEDITMGGTEPEAGETTVPEGAGVTAGGAATTSTANVAPGIPEPAPGLTGLESIVPPSKKDTSLREFLSQMDDYAPIIPDAVTAHYLTVAGLPPPGPGPNNTPPHLARLLALATQKFIADIAADSYQYSRIRSSNSASSNNPMGSINVTAGLSSAAQGGQPGGAGAAGAAGTGEVSTKGKSGAGGLHLGVQRAGFGGGGQGGSQGKTVLTMEDLGMAVGEYGVSVKRGEFYR
ncbi:transcription initiation factor TFIID subunit 10 [Trichophyton mentagrophytes]|uniref:RNA polymerase II transcription factor n=2 Tax=Trichophyton interdigitale TaxID=101480 RepID=A0A9P4YK62_9EURO|nr:hypothetical protein H101_05025 [Trichophyton interdigitale H6]KAF3895717.1 RNA polymerase II transcription factor [Trichophyton interdigitale]KDB25481.1 hypothetical protein H109_02695 [Trichophyton interdigitale MR816]GBF61966.1 transcription initiation factor TFIID subunit 10 [Trichophyton mentagrophytes]KAF3900515.1 RNA polymerase II transcription factor [Trichophyton interdigitale]